MTLIEHIPHVPLVRKHERNGTTRTAYPDGPFPVVRYSPWMCALGLCLWWPDRDSSPPPCLGRLAGGSTAKARGEKPKGDEIHAALTTCARKAGDKGATVAPVRKQSQLGKRGRSTESDATETAAGTLCNRGTAAQYKMNTQPNGARRDMVDHTD